MVKTEKDLKTVVNKSSDSTAIKNFTVKYATFTGLLDAHLENMEIEN